MGALGGSEVSAFAVLVVKALSRFLFAFLWPEVDVEGIIITVVFGEPPWVLVDVSALVAVYKTWIANLCGGDHGTWQ